MAKKLTDLTISFESLKVFIENTPSFKRLMNENILISNFIDDL